MTQDSIYQVYAGQLEVNIKQLKDKLYVKIFGLQDVFFDGKLHVKLKVIGSSSAIRHRTSVVQGGKSWNDRWSCRVKQCKYITLSVWKTSQKSDLVGCMTFDLHPPQKHLDVCVADGWYYLLDKNIGVEKHLKVEPHHNQSAAEGGHTLWTNYYQRVHPHLTGPLHPLIIQMRSRLDPHFMNPSQDDQKETWNNESQVYTDDSLGDISESQHVYERHRINLTICTEKCGLKLRGNSRVSSLEPHSPAERAGLYIDDIIVEINGYDITDRDAVSTAAMMKKLGQKGSLVITVMRSRDQSLSFTSGSSFSVDSDHDITLGSSFGTPDVTSQTKQNSFYIDSRYSDRCFVYDHIQALQMNQECLQDRWIE